MLVIDATVGGASSNSYETSAEAVTYYAGRLSIAGWDNVLDQTVLLVMATRVLNAMNQPRRILMPPQSGEPAYYRIARQWTGLPATPTQKLAWPRVGMFDANNNPLDLAIVSNTAANPTVLSTGMTPHRLVNGQSVLVFNDASSVPTINGTRTVTVIDAYSFSIPVVVTVAGTGARVAWIPQELKDAESELAGQLGNADRTLDNDVIVQGLTSVRAGSVALTFKNNIFPQVLPDAVINLMPQSWLTDELYVPALQAFFEVTSESSTREGRERSDGWFL